MLPAPPSIATMTSLPTVRTIPFLVTVLLCAGAFVPPCHGQESPARKKVRCYVGTLGEGDRQGIYQATFAADSGQFEFIWPAAEIKNPSFLALHPKHQILYAACVIDEYADSKGDAVAAFQIDCATGKLALLNHQSSRGAVPCHLSVDREGKHLLVANYLGGNVAVLLIDAEGRLHPVIRTVQHHGSSVHNVRQRQPHPHAIQFDAAGRYAFVADAGTDRILVYRFDAHTGALSPNDPPALKVAPGAAPRHLVFHSNGRWAYLINELDSSITAMRYDAMRGLLEAIQKQSPLSAGISVENLAAEIAIHPNGRFRYASNRGHDPIAMFVIDPDTGRLTPLGQHPCGGRTPRHLALAPGGQFLLSAQQDSNHVIVHKIDRATGRLTQTAQQIDVPSPLCLQFVP